MRTPRPKVTAVLTLDEALTQASEENGLEPWYRDCVRPLLRSGPEGYPTCCNGSCEPCAQVLVRVAERARELLGRVEPLLGSHAQLVDK